VDSQTDFSPYLRALPLLWLSLAFLAGILLASLLPLPLWAWLLAAVAATLAGLAFRQKLGWLSLFGLVATCALLLGAARYQAAQPEFNLGDLAYYNDNAEWVVVRGTVIEPPLQRDSYLELRIEVESILADEAFHQVSGRMLARVNLGSEFHFGDRLLLRGEMVTPNEYEDFSYKDYLAREGIYSLLPFASARRLQADQGSPFWTALYGLRERGLDTLYNLYPAQEAALLAGILLGDESGISTPLKAAFNDTGTRHIVAISGFNISIIAGLLLATFSRWLGRRRAIWLTGAGIGLYTLLVGADAAVVRAAIMGILALVALQAGRQQLALNTLAISAGLMALFNPLLLWDIGFQLSFAATLGLVLYAEPLSWWAHEWLVRRTSKAWAVRLRGPLNDYLFMTLAAQLTTLPLLLFYFQRLSLFSLPANLLILPAQPALMIFGGLSLLVGVILLPLGQVLAFFSWGLAAYSIRVVEFFARLPWASQTLAVFPLAMVMTLYGLLAVLTLRPLREKLKQIKPRPAIVFGILAALCLWFWSAALAAPDRTLQLIMLDVGGEAILIRTPAGRSLLVNAGPSLTRLTDELRRELAFGQELDWLLLAGSQREQIGALVTGLDRVSPQTLAFAAGGEQVEVVRQQAASAGIATTELRAGDILDLGSKSSLKVLSLSSSGAVLLIEWEEFSALLPVGLDRDLIEGSDLSLPPVDLLLLADGGNPALSPPEWLAALSPQIIWVASEDELDAPTQFLVQDFRVLPSHHYGWLKMTTDGHDIWLSSQ
jgi:competence protein ComEC